MTTMTAAEPRDWAGDALETMPSAIVAIYHTCTREELQALVPLAEKVLSVHGETRPELADVVTLLRELTKDLLPHMLKEEQVLFPYVEQLAQAAAGNRPAPTPFFGTVKNPVRMLMLEHDRVADLLSTLRVVADDYTPPESACADYRELYARLAELERLTHEHVHVENDVFFPRAVDLEERAGNPGTFAFGCKH